VNRQAVYGFLLGIAVLGAGVLWFQFFVMPAEVAPPAARELPSRGPAQETAQRSTPQPTSDSDEASKNIPSEARDPEPPPLFGRDTDPPRANAESPTTGATGRSSQKVRELRRIQRELMATTQSPDGPSPKRVAQLIGELRSNLGSDVVSDVNLDRLQETVERADQMQSLANEMKSIADDPSKEDEQRILDLVSEMKRVRDGLPTSSEALQGGGAQ